MKDWFVKWFQKFWDKHGERVVWMVAALVLAVLVWRFMGLEAEAKTVIIGIMMLIYNKIRSPEKEVDNERNR